MTVNSVEVQTAPEVAERLLRRHEVERLVAHGRSWIYARMAEGTFPHPVRCPGGSVRWRYSDVVAWINQQAEG